MLFKIQTSIKIILSENCCSLSIQQIKQNEENMTRELEKTSSKIKACGHVHSMAYQGKTKYKQAKRKCASKFNNHGENMN